MATSGKKDRRVTPRQMQILRFIRDHEQEHGYAPTMQELADELGISKVTVFEHLEHLRRKGLVKRRRHEARSMALTERVVLPQRRAGSLPLAGVIAAGEPIDAVSQPQTIDADEFFAGRSERFVLQVRGDSMIDEQIRGRRTAQLDPQRPNRGRPAGRRRGDAEEVLSAGPPRASAGGESSLQAHRRARRSGPGAGRRSRGAAQVLTTAIGDLDLVTTDGRTVGRRLAYQPESRPA